MSEQKRVVQEVGMLDWSALKSEDDLKDIEMIQEVGVIIIPESLSGALARIPMQEVGTVVTIPDGCKVSLQSGQLKMTGEALSTLDPDTVMILVGQLHITTLVTSVGCKEMQVTGQVFAPRGSEAALSPKITKLTGQVIYHPLGCRFLLGDETYGTEFLEMLQEPTPLMVCGRLVFEDDVTTELLKAKINEIVLMGQIVAPKHLIPTLQFLCVEKMGEIAVSGGDAS